MTESARPSRGPQAEYLGRIQRVVDFIEANLGRELTLEELAGVACFSPFHFHRLFSAITGETLYQFILRLRLEKAATQLVYEPDKSITAVALDCGFGSSATFARAFRSAFDMTASEWRDGGSKNRKTLRKPRKDAPAGEAYRPSIAVDDGGEHNESWRDAMQQMKEPQSIRVENLEAMQLAYVRHVGPYAGDAALFGRLWGKLMTWAGARNLIGPTTRMLTIYHDNPEITDEDKLRISVCIDVPRGTRTDGEVGTLELPAGKYAIALFELATDEFGAAWNWLYGKWLPESGFQPDDRPCFERCIGTPENHPQKKHVVEICAPVRPL